MTSKETANKNEGGAKPSLVAAAAESADDDLLVIVDEGTEMGGADGPDGAETALRDAKDEDEEVGDEETIGFEGWARVFFQGRDDRSAQQLLPTNSSTLARESHLFVVVDPDATELRLYPDSKDLRLIVDPPIELKYFYAVSVRPVSSVYLIERILN